MGPTGADSMGSTGAVAPQPTRDAEVENADKFGGFCLSQVTE